MELLDISLSSLPLATQMALDRASVLDTALLEMWDQACATCAESEEMSSAAQRSSLAGAARRRVPRRQVDTDDFFTLADALDTLTEELRESNAKEAAALPSKATTDIPSDASAPPRLTVDQLNPRNDPTQPAAQQEAVRAAHAAFHEGQIRTALDHFLHAASLCMSHELTPSLLHNIAVCHYKLEQWELCESATQRVRAADTAQVYPSAQRLVRLCVYRGKLEEAQRLLAAHRDTATAWGEEVAAVKAFAAYNTYFASRQYTRARDSLDQLLTLLPCGALEALKARLLSLDSMAAAVLFAQARLSAYPHSTELQLTLSELTFHSATSVADLDGLLARMQSADATALELRHRLLHTHVSRCREAFVRLEGLAHSQAWAAAVAYVSETIHEPFLSDGIKGAMYGYRARALELLGASRYETLDDAHRALSYTEAPAQRAQLLLLVARCEEALQRWRDAVEHTEESQRLSPQPTTAEYLRKLHRQRAQQQQQSAAAGAAASSKGAAPPPRGKQQQQQQRPSPHAEQSRAKQPPPAQHKSLDVFYQSLRLERGATAVEVRKSYRALAMKWHPDRWCGATPPELQEAESRFKAIQEAYEQLMQHAS